MYPQAYLGCHYIMYIPQPSNLISIHTLDSRHEIRRCLTQLISFCFGAFISERQQMVSRLPSIQVYVQITWLGLSMSTTGGTEGIQLLCMYLARTNPTSRESRANESYLPTSWQALGAASRAGTSSCSPSETTRPGQPAVAKVWNEHSALTADGTEVADFVLIYTTPGDDCTTLYPGRSSTGFLSFHSIRVI